MASGALFSSGSGGNSASKNIVEFKAGKMEYKGSLVTPDTRKGMIYLHQSDDALMHFCWMDRKNGKVEDDLILFPDDAEFLHVSQCKTGRVYLLKFKLTSRRMFFWVQEPKTDKDDENCKKVNECLNNPQRASATSSSSAGGHGRNHSAGQHSATPTSAAGKSIPGTAASMMNNLPPEILQGLGSDTDLHSLLGNMSQQQLMQLLSGMGGLSGLSNILSQPLDGRPASATSQESTADRQSRLLSNPATETPLSGGRTKTPGAPTKNLSKPSTAKQVSTPLKVSDLNMALSGLSTAKGSPKPEIDLSTALSADIMAPLLNNADICKILKPLLPDYEGAESSNELKDTLNSAQFKQAMSTFSQALATGQLGPVIAQFNLGAEVTEAATRGDVEAFVKAMQAAEDANTPKQEVKKEDTVEVKKEDQANKKDEKKKDEESKKEDVKKPEDMEVD